MMNFKMICISRLCCPNYKTQSELCKFQITNKFQKIVKPKNQLKIKMMKIQKKNISKKKNIKK